MTAVISNFLSSWRARGKDNRSAPSAGERMSGKIVDVPSAHQVWVVLDLAESDLVLLPFLVQAPPDLPDHDARQDLIFEAAPGQPA